MAAMNQTLSTHKYYASAVADAAPPEEEKPRQIWNGYLTTICILFAVSSLLGALSAARGFYGLLQPAEEIKVGRSVAERQMQKIQQSRQDAVRKYYPVLLFNELLKLVAAAGLMFAAVYLLSRQAQARKFAIGAAGLALFFNVCALLVAILMIAETGGVVNSVLDDAFSRGSFQSAEEKAKTRDLVENTMLTAVTIAVGVAFLFKLIYYGVILAYLWSDDVKKIFGEDPLAYMEKEAAEEAARTGVPTPA
jgi:hypothetical protein